MNVQLATQHYDLINAALNMGGAVAISTSIFRVLRDKMVKGVHWGMLIFFITWSIWNLVLYTHVGLWYSFLAGIIMVITEATYLFLLIFYSKIEKDFINDSYNSYLSRLEGGSKSAVFDPHTSYKKNKKSS
jgi:hypothetical protein